MLVAINIKGDGMDMSITQGGRVDLIITGEQDGSVYKTVGICL